MAVNLSSQGGDAMKLNKLDFFLQYRCSILLPGPLFIRTISPYIQSSFKILKGPDLDEYNPEQFFLVANRTLQRLQVVESVGPPKKSELFN